MSVNLYSASGSGGNDAVLQSTTVGGSKPLHRFIKGQPKIVGIIVLILGASYFLIFTALYVNFPGHHIWTAIPPGYLLGSLFIICGVLFILTEHNPTKKKVTVSLALSIVTILVGFWTTSQMIVDLGPYRYHRHDDYSENYTTESDEEEWRSNVEAMVIIVEIVFTFYNVAGIITFIVMSSFAGAALRSTKTQAVVVMSAAPAE